MFSNKFRLRKPDKIATVFRMGKYIHAKYLFIKYLPNNDKNVKIAISVSTKLFKQAIKRNKIKRLIREATKPYLSKFPHLDILVIAKKDISTDIKLEKLKEDILTILNKL